MERNVKSEFSGKSRRSRSHSRETGEPSSPRYVSKNATSLMESFYDRSQSVNRSRNERKESRGSHYRSYDRNGDLKSQVDSLKKKLSRSHGEYSDKFARLYAEIHAEKLKQSILRKYLIL